MIAETISLIGLAIAMLIFSNLKPVQADTIILQNGADGYAGCTTRTLWGTDVAEKMEDSNILYLRGSHNRLSARFGLPDDLADRTFTPFGRGRLCEMQSGTLDGQRFDAGVVELRGRDGALEQGSTIQCQPAVDAIVSAGADLI